MKEPNMVSITISQSVEVNERRAETTVTYGYTGTESRLIDHGGLVMTVIRAMDQAKAVKVGTGE